MTVHRDRHAIDAIVLDIEGTTTPIAFVHDVLFPFARRRLREHLREQRGSDELNGAIRRLREEWAEDQARGEARGEARGGAPPPWIDEADAEESSVASYVEWLMDRDRKSPGLKLLQGHIWERGYRSGALEGEVFPDVGPAIRRWRASGIIVAIYSSGSELAQRLLFATAGWQEGVRRTSEGDLTTYVSGFFDTRVGAKSSCDSYRRIAAALHCSTERQIFVSDTVQELHAAREAGCKVLLCGRPGHAPRSAASGATGVMAQMAPMAPMDIDVIHSFDEIDVG